MSISSSQGLEGGNDFGTNSYEQKMRLIEESKNDSLSLDDMTDLGTLLSKALTEDLPKAAIATAGNVAKTLLPGFLKRMQKRKIHTQQIQEIEKRQDKVVNDVNSTIIQERQQRKADRATTKMIQEMLNARKHLDEEVKKVLDEDIKHQAAVEIEDYKRRRDLQIEEMEEKRAKEAKEKEDAMERDATDRRLWSINFFGSKVRELSEESNQVRLKNKSALAHERQEALDKVVNEWEEREFSRAKMQVELPSLTGPILFPKGDQVGIFDLPPSPSVTGSIAPVDGVDQRDSFVFTVNPHTEFEEAEVSKIDLESELIRHQQFYDSLQHESSSLDKSIEKMCVMRDVLERDQMQVNQELLSIEKDQFGPPRRLAMQHEIKSIDTWKQRSAQIKKKLEDLQYTVDKADSRKRFTDAQSLDIAHKIAVLKEKQRVVHEGQRDDTNVLGSLPIVIGRSIGKVPGMGAQFAKPKEALNAITHQSKLIGMKAQGDDVSKIHKQTIALDQEIWVKRQTGQEDVIEYERLLSRLSDMFERLNKVGTQNSRENLIDALKAFFARGISLNPLKSKLVGILPWYSHHDPLVSHNVVRYITDNVMGAITFESADKKSDGDKTSDGAADSSGTVDESAPAETDSQTTDTALSFSSGVTLGEEKMGYCAGMINLPKDSLWTILVTITKQGTGEVFDNPDPSDFVTVKIGATYTSLSTVGVFYNRINPITGTVLYDVKHVFKGASFAFRFDFSSSIKDVRKHLAICTGLYEEYEMQAIETREDPANGRTKVLSSYVKVLRIDQQSGKFKDTKLIEELSNIESSDSPHWDSDILNNYSQRYSREYFLRILRAEILIQQDIAIAAAAAAAKKKEQSSFETKVIMAGADLNREAKLEMSMKRYITKKRLAQKHILDEAEDLVSKRLVIWDAINFKWRNISVLSCQVKWVEGGLVAKVTHLVQEYDDGNDKVGGEMEIDLKAFKYFLSPMQKFDKETMLRWKERKEFNLKITGIGKIANDKVQRLQDTLEKYIKQMQKSFELKKQKRLAQFEATADQDARRRSNVNTQAMKRVLKALLQDIVVDVRKGLVSLDADSEVSKNDQLKALAKERFITNWITDQRKQLEIKLTEESVDLNRKLQQRHEDAKQLQKRIREKAAEDVRDATDVMRRKTLKRKTGLLAKVKFDPQVFKKAVPTAVNCEHLRTKAWGDKYSKGVKCLVCGKELSQLEKEESQLLGFGSGADTWMVDAVKRHRQNEASFRFKNSEEIAAVESERRRLEKERREMEEQEAFFYDFQDLRIVYDFDHRHAATIKKAGVFRQGLHWTEEELIAYGETKKRELTLQLLSEGKSDLALANYDPLQSVQEPPPTLRAADERHQAQYNELLFSIGRLKTFAKRIDDFRMARFEPIESRKMYATILESLYHDANVIEDQLDMLEKDLDKTSKLLSTLARMQVLMEQSNKIKAQAMRDKKKAEMKQVGVWDNVQDCRDKTTVAHDETRTLLRSKLLNERKLEDQQKLIGFRVVNLEAARLKFAESERVCTALKYCMPGNLVMTKFGECIISSYRPKDDMLLVLLPFGNPPAKAYLHYKEVVDLEMSKAKAEALMMEVEDQQTQHMVAEERIMIKKECYLMAKAEEGLKEIYDFLDMSVKESAVIKNSIDESVNMNFQITESKVYKRLQSETVEKLLKKEKLDLEKRREEYIGPNAGRPRKMSMWDTFRARKAIEMELKSKFILKAANKMEASTKERLRVLRSAWVQDKIVDSIIDGEIKLLFTEIANDALSEGKAAKGFAEKKSGIIFPHPLWMQYGAYDSLSSIWKTRKDELRHKIEVSKGESAKLLSIGSSSILLKKKEKQRRAKLSLEELERIKVEKKAKKIEKLRQEKICAEMLREEIVCKDFYRWELKINLRERRSMKDEENMSFQMRKAEKEKKLAIEAAIKAGLGLGAAGGKDGSQLSEAEQQGKSYERRRQELKDLTIERRRRAEDQALMIIEDKFSTILREIDKAERQKKAFLAQFGSEGAADAENAAPPPMDAMSGGIGNEPVDEEDKEVVEMINGQPVLKVPEWLLPKLPLSFYQWDVKRQNKYIRMMIRIHIKQKRTKLNIQREIERLEKLHEKSYNEWADLHRVVEQEEMESELSMMEAEEELRETEAKLEDIKENGNRLATFCREKGEEELKLRTQLRKLEELARKRDRELSEADDWLTLCIRRSKNRDKLKRKVNDSCKWIDTESVNGFYQRFATQLLRERLYMTYFRQIVDSLITRAEIIASERKIMKLQEELTINKEKLLERLRAKQFLLYDIRRDEYMRMRRSFLNEKFFPKNRRNVLKEKFGGWVRYFLWNRGHKEAFELKYELIKRQLDIDRQFKEQLKQSNAKPSPASPQDRPQGGKGKGNIHTLMERHKERTIQCKHCLKLYIESQNTSISCEYHPKSYILACPKTCSNPGLTAICSAHRMRRWPCCDSVKQECVGCCRRSHCAPDSDPVYDFIMDSINERDRDVLETLEERVSHARSQDFPALLNAAKKNKIFEIEDKLAMGRAAAERYKTMKFV